MHDEGAWDPTSGEGRRLRAAGARARGAGAADGCARASGTVAGACAAPASRRRFLGWLAGGAAALGLLPRRAAALVVPGLGERAAGGAARPAAAGGPRVAAGARAARRGAAAAGTPLAVASGNGVAALEHALARLAGGAELLEAAVAGVQLVEDDPDDMSVGYGGLPNEEGVVELDAAVMDGATHRAGAVAALRNVRHPSRVALRVLERTDHVLLVGEGALRFARAHGFPEEDLLTERARERWLAWKEGLSDDDDWLSTTRDPDGSGAEPGRPGGTIHVSMLDGGGNVACVTTTSGLAFKLPGRVGDSPILGAGLYCTNEAGSCGATGRGEAVILECGSFAVVEHMRHGRSPTEACLEVLGRIARHAPARHRDADGRPRFDVQLYCLSTAGEYAGAALLPGGRFAVADPERGARLEDCVTVG